MKIDRRTFIFLSTVATGSLLVLPRPPVSAKKVDTSPEPIDTGWDVAWDIGGWDIGVSPPIPPVPNHDIFMPVVAVS